MGSGRRSFWGCGAVFVICLLLLALYLAAFPEEPSDAIEAVGPLVFAVFLSLMLVWRLPHVLTKQGISVGTAGVDFVQEPKWWFRGRTLSVPWNKSRGFLFSSPTGPNGGNNSGNQLRQFSAYLYRTPPKDLVPTWLNLIAEGMDGDALSGSPLARVTFSVDANTRTQLQGALNTYRPDMLLERPPLAQGQAMPASPPGMAGPSGAPGGPGAPMPPVTPAEPVQGSVSARGHHAMLWFFWFSMATMLSVTMSLGPLAQIFQTIDSAGTSSLRLTAFLPVLLIGVGALLAVCALIFYLPHHWTTQGVHVGPSGIAITKDPMWWFRGHRAIVPWHDVHHIAVSVRSSGSGNNRSTRQIAELHLHRVDHEMRLPRWAFLVMAGETKRGFSAFRPLLVLDMRSSVRSGQLTALLRRARPDLFEEAVVARADAQRWSTPHPAQPAHTPGYSGPPPSPSWVSTRPRRGLWWGAGVLVVLYHSGWFALSLVREVADPASEALPVETIAWFCAGAIALALLWLWVIWGAPRCLTHQGVSVDESGVTLVQEPRLWFEGRTVFLPWDGVRMVRGATLGHRSGTKVVKVFLHGPGMVTHAPTWCAVNPRENIDVPATPQQPLTKVTLSTGRKFGAVLNAVRKMRPDLIPM